MVLADGPTTSWLEVADILHSRFGALACKAPTEKVPGEALAPPIIHERAKQELGFRFRPAEMTIVDTVESMQELGVLT